MKRHPLGCGLLALGVFCSLALPVAAAPPPKKSNLSPLNLFGESAGSSRHSGSSAQRAIDYQATADYDDGATEMRAKSYASAEDSFEASLANVPDGLVYLGLAEALTAQGKAKEALQAYWDLFHPGLHQSWGGSYFSQAEMEYAVLLSENGRWSEAVDRYQKALAEAATTYRNPPEINAYFDLANPEPKKLQAAAHIGTGLGVKYGGGDFDASVSERAFQEYAKALGYGFVCVVPKIGV